jgi:undecaprenyl diphosphate synthase
LAPSVLREIEKAERATAAGHRLHLRVAIDYSSRDSIALAATGEHAAYLHEARSSPDEIAQTLTRTLTAECGDVDLLIRTGGEKRLSDFLLWESAYAELHFTDRMWPDFDEDDLEAALNEFSRRERRFGAVPEATALLVGGVQ